MPDLDLLWRPMALGATIALNRIYLPAHGVGLVGAEYGAYLRERALGGVGLIVVHGMPVHITAAMPGGPEPWTRAWIPQIAEVIAPPRAAGCPTIVQLAHNGPNSVRRVDDHWGPLWAPSAIPSPVYRMTPKAMDCDEIAELISAFATTAAHVQEAGGDGVEIHAAHGYLLSSFLSPFWNRRADDYGGDTHKRARIVRKIGAAIRKRCGSGFTVGVKLNADEYLGAVGTTPAEGLEVLTNLHEAKLFDYFTIAHTDYHNTHRLIPPQSGGIDDPPLAAAARAARARVGESVPILVAGSVRDLGTAAGMVARGEGDLIGLARAHIADPHIILKARTGRTAEIRRCIGANQGCWRRRMHGQPVVCTVNPIVGRERRWEGSTVTLTEQSRRLLVVGGGPAGLKFAETAATAGHHVTLWEASASLGGQIRLAASLPYANRWQDLVDDLSASVRRLSVNVCLNTPAAAAGVVDFGADVTVIATGATWDRQGFSTFRPDREGIPGAESAHVVDPDCVIAAPEQCGRRVAIIDDNGDYLPLGLALLLAAAGRSVTIVTQDSSVGRRIEATLDLPWVLPRLAQAGVRIATTRWVDRINAGRIVLGSVWGGEPIEVEADTVILSMMRRSSDALFHELRTLGLATIRIGDCVAPREVDDAIFEGFREAALLT